MQTRGTVRMWSDEGWGVIDSPQTPGGCWVHWSVVLVAGYRHLAPRQALELDYEVAEQDGYRFRAVRAWPRGREPVDDAVRGESPSEASASSMLVTCDEQPSAAGRER